MQQLHSVSAAFSSIRVQSPQNLSIKLRLVTISSIHPPIRPSIHPSLHPSIHPSFHLSFRRAVCPSTSLSLSLSKFVRLSVRSSACLSLRSCIVFVYILPYRHWYNRYGQSLVFTLMYSYFHFMLSWPVLTVQESPCHICNDLFDCVICVRHIVSSIISAFHFEPYTWNKGYKKISLVSPRFFCHHISVLAHRTSHCVIDIIVSKCIYRNPHNDVNMQPSLHLPLYAQWAQKISEIFSKVYIRVH